MNTESKAELSLVDDFLTEYNQLLQMLDDHDDRGLVLSLAAFAEDTLGRLLMGYLRESKHARELVEGFNAPLGTFAARIKAAFTMGLLQREQFEDLEVLRRIRNEFAHNWKTVSFDRADIKSRIGKLHVHYHGQQPRELVGDGRLRNSLTWVLLELRLMMNMHAEGKTQAPFRGINVSLGIPEQPTEQSEYSPPPIASFDP